MPLWFKDVWAKTLASWLTLRRDRQTSVSKKKTERRSKISTSCHISLKLEECLYENILECRKKMKGKRIAENKRERNTRRKWCKPLFSSNKIEWHINYQFNSEFIAVFCSDWSLIRSCAIVAVLLNLSSGTYSCAKWQTDTSSTWRSH